MTTPLSAASSSSEKSIEETNRFSYQVFNFTTAFAASLLSYECECASLAAKIGFFVLPIILVTDAFILLFFNPFVWCAKQICIVSGNKAPLQRPPCGKSSLVEMSKLVPDHENLRRRVLVLPPSVPVDPRKAAEKEAVKIAASPPGLDEITEEKSTVEMDEIPLPIEIPAPPTSIGEEVNTPHPPRSLIGVLSEYFHLQKSSVPTSIEPAAPEKEFLSETSTSEEASTLSASPIGIGEEVDSPLPAPGWFEPPLFQKGGGPADSATTEKTGKQEAASSTIYNKITSIYQYFLNTPKVE